MTAPKKAPKTVAFPTPAEYRSRREALGISRGVMSKLCDGLSTSRIWAIEQTPEREVTDAHKTLVLDALVKVEKDGLPAEFAKPEKKPAGETKAALETRLNTASLLLAQASEATTLKVMKEFIVRLQVVVSGEAATADEPVTETVDA
jgi:hypothetical protein